MVDDTGKNPKSFFCFVLFFNFFYFGVFLYDNFTYWVYQLNSLNLFLLVNRIEFSINDQILFVVVVI